MYKKLRGVIQVNEFGIRLKELREKKHVSMDEICMDLSKIYGVNLAKSTISKWENGKSEPTMSYAKILSKYFGVTLDYILMNDPEPKSKPIDTINKLVNDSGINTIAAHHESDEFTEEDKEDIENFINYILSKKNK
jgi:transcriptional regulator with XRE-family HTH domain